MIIGRSLRQLRVLLGFIKNPLSGICSLVPALLLASGLLFLNGCSGVYVSGTIGNPNHGDVQGEHMNIPPGHMPPPGKCRIWYPGLPPGQQPSPGECYDLQYQVPPEAVLVRG